MPSAANTRAACTSGVMQGESIRPAISKPFRNQIVAIGRATFPGSFSNQIHMLVVRPRERVVSLAAQVLCSSSYSNSGRLHDPTGSSTFRRGPTSRELGSSFLAKCTRQGWRAPCAPSDESYRTETAVDRPLSCAGYSV